MPKVKKSDIIDFSVLNGEFYFVGSQLRLLFAGHRDGYTLLCSSGKLIIVNLEHHSEFTKETTFSTLEMLIDKTKTRYE